MTLDLSLSGKHALVCGASSGIGRAAALEIAALGAEVTALARNQAALQALLPELQAAGASAAHALAVDVEDRTTLDAAIRGRLEGGGAFHVLVNNSGGPPAGPILEASADDFEKALGRHLLASHLLVKLCLPGMEASGFGRIVNIISTSVREPIPNLGVSNTTRGAMASWAKSLSRELPPGVTINNVLPGFTDTERLTSLAEAIAQRTGKSVDEVRAGWLATVPEGRLGRPEELAAAIAFLVCPAASYIRGVSLAVDGGRLQSI